MSKQINSDYLIWLLTEKSYAISHGDDNAIELGMTLTDIIQVVSEVSEIAYMTTPQRLKNMKSKNTKKARLVLGVTEQVAEDQWERHMKTVDVDVPISTEFDPKGADIIGGHWVENKEK